MYGELQSRRAACRRHTIAYAHVLGELTLECRDVLTEGARDLAGAHRVGHSLDLVISDVRLVHGNHVKRTFSSTPTYGPCLISSNTVSSSIRTPWPPAMSRTTSPSPSSTVVTRARSSPYTSSAHLPLRTKSTSGVNVSRRSTGRCECAPAS